MQYILKIVFKAHRKTCGGLYPLCPHGSAAYDMLYHSYCITAHSQSLVEAGHAYTVHRTSSHYVQTDNQSRRLTWRKRIQPVVTDREVSQSCNRKRTENEHGRTRCKCKGVFAQQLSSHLNHFRKDRHLIFS